MKFVLLILAVLLAIVSNSFAAVARGNYNDPNHPGKCAIRPDLIIGAGETVQHPDHCGRIICGNNGEAQFHTCGKRAIQGNCRFGDKLYPDGDYPKCCEREIICLD